MTNPLPIVAIIGRTNVGKSTLFNRLIEKRRALVSETPGTTRDRKYGICRWRGKKFQLTDTGGIIDVDIQTEIEKNVFKQSLIALEEADLVLFILDICEGVLPADRQVASKLRKSGKPVVLVINKADNPAIRNKTNPEEFKRLGLGEPFLVSAANGTGTGDALDEILKKIPGAPETQPPQNANRPNKITIIGKPNVGKSSLLNAILKEERAIVSSQPHTTREPQDTLIQYKDRPILIADTAGIRRKSKIKSLLERAGVHQSLKYLEKADVILFVVDVLDRVSTQDKRLASLIVKSEKSVLMVVNKYDLIPEKKSKIIQDYENYFKQNFPHLFFAPLIFTSAKTNFNVDKILDLVLSIAAERQKTIDHQDLTQIINLIKPPSDKKNLTRVRDLIQTDTNPPHFTLISSGKQKLPLAILGIVKKSLYKKFGFLGTPIKLNARLFKK